MLGMGAPKIDNREVAFHIGRHPVHKPRHPRQYLNETTAGHDAFPLLVLFGLNAVDELDRTIFGVLAPNIRDAFHLSNGGFTALVAVTLLGGLLLEVPLAFYSDRLPRVRIAVLGAAVWAVFGLMTGLVTTLAWLVFARSGAGMGRAVVDPNPQLAAFRLLPDRSPSRCLRLPSHGERPRRVHRPRSRRRSSRTTPTGASRSSSSSSRRSCS